MHLELERSMALRFTLDENLAESRSSDTWVAKGSGWSQTVEHNTTLDLDVLFEKLGVNCLYFLEYVY